MRVWDVFEGRGNTERLSHTADGVCVCMCVSGIRISWTVHLLYCVHLLRSATDNRLACIASFQCMHAECSVISVWC